MAWSRGRRGPSKPPQTSEEYAKQFAETLIKQIEEGTAPWQKTWEPGQRQLPRNIESKREYRGGNTLVLMATAEVRGYGDSRWGTYRQIIAAGGQVRKGERATRITLYKPVGESRQEAGDRDEDRDREKEDGRERRAIVQRYAVFNVDQADGIEPERREAVPAWKAIQEAEKVLEKGAPMRHVNGDRAWYNLARDLTTLPEKSQFKEARDYYLTALHEAGHSTGHPSRMDRESLAKGVADGHGSPAYAREELRAEISSMMTGDRIGIGHKPQHGAAYVKSWVATLKDDPSEILRAANDATRISHYLTRKKSASWTMSVRPTNSLSRPLVLSVPNWLPCLNRESARKTAHAPTTQGNGKGTETFSGRLIAGTWRPSTRPSTGAAMLTPGWATTKQPCLGPWIKIPHPLWVHYSNAARMRTSAPRAARLPFTTRGWRRKKSSVDW